MRTKWIGIMAIVLVAGALLGYKTYSGQVAGRHAAASGTPPRVLLVADLGEADEAGDACAEIIHLVRAARARGVAVRELNADSASPLIRRYHVMTIPTVLILGRSGRVVARYEGEGAGMVHALRTALAGLN